MHVAHLTVAITGPSIKIDQYEYHTPSMFAATGPNDNDQPIKLITKQGIAPNAKVVDCIGMLRFGDKITSVQLHCESAIPVLVTPDTWGDKHPWNNKEGLVQRNNFVTLMDDRLGGEESFRTNNTAKGDPVMNCSVASRDHLEILGGRMDAKPAWFKATFWGAAALTAQALTAGQRVQLMSGLLSFQHWGTDNDMVTVNISVRTFLKGASASGIPSRDGEAPPVEATAADDQPPATEEVPPVASPQIDYAGIPMP